MRVLIDIGHPAHVHLFKNLYKKLKEDGNNVWVTVRDISAAKKLLNIYDIPYECFGSKSDGIFNKLFDQVKFNIRLLNFISRNKINIGIGTSINIAHVSRISEMTSFVIDDDDSAVQPLMAKFGHPFADYLISPSVLEYERKKKNHITYPGYHELAYLHPKIFKPDPNVLTELGIDEKDKYFILRFNAFKAHHDVGVSGLTKDQKRFLVDRLKKEGQVYITTERDIDEEFADYELKISPEKTHSLLYYATLFIGDSQTMTSEAAVLGIPSIRCNSFAGRISYLEEQEKKYKLTYAFLPEEFDELKIKLESLLNKSNIKDEWRDKRDKMLRDKIYVTDFFFDVLKSFSTNGRLNKEKLNFNIFE